MFRPNFESLSLIEASPVPTQHSSNPGREIPLLRALFKSQKPIRLGPRSPMFREGDRADHVYLLDDGVARTYRFFPNGRRMLARFLFPGDVAGLEFNDYYPFTAETIQEVEYYRVSIRHLESLRAHSTRLQDELIWALRHHIAAGNAEILPLMHQHAEARIARLLSTLARRRGCVMRNGARINLPMPRADIADYLGLTKETVCRTFAKMKGDHVIALLCPQAVEVINAHRLQELAD